MKTIKLTNGTQMPVIGSGTNTFGKENNEYNGKINGDTTELDAAIQNGYRHFDTAISYRNESVIGDAIKNSSIDRSEFFITSKLPGEPEYTESKEAVRKGLEDSLEALQTDYIDLYLIHHPWDDMEGMVKVYKVLEDLVDEGLIKEIGVSNFDKDQLDNILTHARIKPAVNQIQSNPNDWNNEVINHSLENNVVPVAWSPLSVKSDEARDTLTKIGEQYNKSWAQVVLNYQVNRGVAVIPKSSNAERQQQNLDIFDFELSKEDKEQIENL